MTVIGYLVTLDGNASSGVSGLIVQRVMRQMVGEIRDVYEAVPGRDGAWLFPELSGMRNIQLTCKIVSDSGANRRAAVRAAADWMETPDAVQLVVDDEPDRYYIAKLADAPSPDEMVHRADFQIGFKAQPYAYALTTSSQSVTAASGVNQTYTAPDNVSAFPIVEITPVGGNLNGFTLVYNGLYLVYEGVLSSGSTLTISSLTYTVTEGANLDTELTGAVDYDSVDMNDVSGDFPVVKPGTNNYSIVPGAGSTNTSTIIVTTWRRRYR